MITRKQSTRASEPLSQSLDEVVQRRVDFLTHYQDAKYAEHYYQRIQAFKALESRVSGAPGKLTDAVARNYFKVLAIKDEYEVARLYTRPEFLEKIGAQFEGDYRLQFHLAPPLFSGGKKSGYGSWMLKAFKLLSSVRRIRNTWLDPFARTHERKVELAWLQEYERLLDLLESGLSPEKLELAVTLAELPDAVRGYGPVKDRYLVNAQERLQQLSARWMAAEFVDASIDRKPTIALKQL
jgi:indolepyruvate ferredoxin oxidoreductase